MKKKDEKDNASAAPKEKKDKFREYFEAILVAVIFASFVKIFIFQTYKIPTESMVKTLLVGDHLIVDKFGFRDPGSGLLKKILPFRDIQRGDVVVFKFPKEPRFFFVKRVIGLPGDVVQIINKKIYVNGQATEEPYAVFADENVFRRMRAPRHPALPGQHGGDQGPSGTVLLHGRQPRPLQRQPLLGVRPARFHRRASLGHLLVL